MLIPLRYKYTNYGKQAPKATAYSHALGIFFCLTSLAVWGFLWAAFFGFVLANAMPEETAYVIAFVSLIPFYWLLNRLKKRLADKVDSLARKEIQSHMQNQSLPK